MGTNKTHSTTCLLISLGVVFIAFLTYSSISRFKKRKTRLDVLQLEKSGMKIIAFLYFIIAFLIQLMKIEIFNLELTKYVLMPCIINLLLFNLFLTYENYKQVKDPSLVFRAFLSKNSFSGLYEVLIILITTINVLLMIFGKHSVGVDSGTELLEQNFYALIFCFLISLLSLIFYFLKRKRFEDYRVGSKKNAVTRNLVEFIVNLIYFTYTTLLLVLCTLLKFAIMKQEITGYFFSILSYSFFIIVIVDSILTLYTIYKSDFYYYTLGSTNYKYFYRVFGRNVYKKPILTVDFNSFSANTKNCSVLYFHNHLSYMIDEYLIDTFDNMINISLASLYLIFSSSYNERLEEGVKKGPALLSPGKEPREASKSPSHLARISEDEVSKILNDKQQRFIENSEDSSIIKENCQMHFKFQKKDFQDERLARLIAFNPEDDSLMINGGDLNENLMVNIKSYYTEYFANLIKQKNININFLKESLISHLSTSTASWNSLLSKNCKEAAFKKQKKLLLNAYDRLFSFEICNEDSIFAKDSTLEDFIPKYLQHMKNNNKSFLPVVLGVYSIKINNFKELVVVLTKNLIIQEHPKEYYNYWQMISIDSKKKMEMLTSSKDRSSALIRDEVLFKNQLKLTLVDYSDFEHIFTDDLRFLKQMGTKDFSLLIMYYEIGAGNSHGNSFDQEHASNPRITLNNNNLSMGAIRVSVINKNKAPSSNAGGNDDNFKFASNKDINVDFASSVLKEINMFKFKDNNGFEAHFNNFKCVLFFVFDNVFDNYKWCTTKSRYSEYFDNVMGNFEESSLLK